MEEGSDGNFREDTAFFLLQFIVKAAGPALNSTVEYNLVALR